MARFADVADLTVRTILLDLAVVLAWVLAVAVVFRTAGWPRWLYYGVALGGVLAFSLAIDPWSRLRSGKEY